jgi:hypothetical protein
MVVERPIGGPFVILAVVVVQARHPEQPASGPSRCGARVAAGARIGGRYNVVPARNHGRRQWRYRSGERRRGRMADVRGAAAPPARADAELGLLQGSHRGRRQEPPVSPQARSMATRPPTLLLRDAMHLQITGSAPPK